jgi:acetylglutamate kinase
VSLVVVKVGGAVASQSAEAVVELAGEHEVCVVHGAGPQISAEMARAGIPVEFVRGLRVTTPAALEVVRASLEAVNAELCHAIGERAVPFFGDEIGFEAEPSLRELGRVGVPTPQPLPALDRVLAAGRIPVVAPLALGSDGSGPVNVNADDAAAAIAVGLDAGRLLFLTDVEGFLLDGEVVDALDVPEAEGLFFGGTLDPRILPKLGAAIEAARRGVTAFIGRTEVVAAARTPGAVDVLVERDRA